VSDETADLIVVASTVHTMTADAPVNVRAGGQCCRDAVRNTLGL